MVIHILLGVFMKGMKFIEKGICWGGIYITYFPDYPLPYILIISKLKQINLVNDQLENILIVGGGYRI